MQAGGMGFGYERKVASLSNVAFVGARAAVWDDRVARAACGQSNTYVAPPPPKVTVAKPVQQKVTRYLEATGNTAAVNTANLVARVQGFLTEINYEDGAPVKKGALLFTIEPEPYQAQAAAGAGAEAAAQAS